jgi:hypothetical protein
MSIHVSRVLYFSRNFQLKNRMMGIGEKLSQLVGTWKGTNRLYVPWMPEKIKESLSTAIVRSKMNDQFLSVEYSWAFDDERQEGLLIIGCDPKSDAVQAVWTDSWHSKDVLMLCNGKFADDGSISVFGKYSVPDHPDWGWRTMIIPSDDRFRYVMHNVTPEGAEDLAVETEFVRD